jgi:thioesterase domain-containing protein
MARQLMALGESISFLGIIDASKPSEPIFVRGLQSVGKHTLYVLLQKGMHAGLHYVRSIREMMSAWKNSARLSRGSPLAPSPVHGHYRFIFGRAVKRYRTQPYPEKVIVFAGATKKNFMISVGGKSLRTSRSARLVALTQKLSL